MSMQDLLSDFVARINNAVMVGKDNVEVLKNGIVVSVCKKLTTLGYFEGFEENGNILIVNIHPSKITKIARSSKPGHRVYVGYQKSPKIIGGIGYNIISTSKGIFTQVECSKEKVGGELLFQIY
jgi:small subunit ribosomal protein S8